MRAFFRDRAFIEVPVQHRLSILAACEDPFNVATFNYMGEVWPLPQTGQMWLEYQLLRDPTLPGVFCVSTSYRNEPKPIPGRHEIIFPMFEFESKGTLDDLRQLESDLCEQLGFGDQRNYAHRTYDEMAKHYQSPDLTSDHERQMHSEFGPVFFLERFPLYTSPFWNMMKNGQHAHKIDVILCGMETIGSAERSSDPQAMRNQFYSISNGEYAGLLFKHFGRERVETELENFLAHDFFPRFGGGIGLTRMMRALTTIA